MVQKLSKFTFMLFLLSGLAISCGSASSKTTQDDISQLYKQNCALCHGKNGNLGLNGAKDFALSEYTLEQKIEIITNGKDKMLPFKNSLSEDQIKALAEYTLTFKK